MDNPLRQLPLQHIINDITKLIEHLDRDHVRWEIRINGGQGRAHVDVVTRKASYTYRHQSGPPTPPAMRRPREDE